MIKKYTTINLDTAIYQSVNLDNDLHDFYLIGITDDESIKSITFSCAIDSGVTGEVAEIGNITLPVYGNISQTRFTGFPTEFWMKPVQVITTDEVVHKDGVYEVEVNINNIALH